ncbi:MaoC family dehydratase [Halorarius litoreus]|uniref:MaoC family dehydratase n=1 Tax=Halorarius litoreus TaxID=2962676 RepID=UPI0020CFE525|nr:MaoC family dehydratase [Halorarius litoreus]
MRFDDLSVGDELVRTVEDLRGDDMKLIAALLQDPYPPHYDPRRAEELGYPGLLNQGPANLAYMLQPIVRELGAPSDLASFDTRFHDMVFEDETVTVTATVEEKRPADDDGLVEFSVVLAKENGETAVDGTVTARFSD